MLVGGSCPVMSRTRTKGDIGAMPSRTKVVATAYCAQVTIPAKVRKHLGVDQGDKLAFVTGDARTVALHANTYPKVGSEFTFACWSKISGADKFVRRKSALSQVGSMPVNASYDFLTGIYKRDAPWRSRSSKGRVTAQPDQRIQIVDIQQRKVAAQPLTYARGHRPTPQRTAGGARRAAVALSRSVALPCAPRLQRPSGCRYAPAGVLPA